MDKHEWKEFLRWLDSASPSQLTDRKVKLREILGVVTDPTVRNDVKRLSRLIDEEFVARQSVTAAERRRSQKA